MSSSCLAREMATLTRSGRPTSPSLNLKSCVSSAKRVPHRGDDEHVPLLRAWGSISGPQPLPQAR
eukprot:7375599-Prymnesium_polylepis.1